jgi:hypothetical protein
MPIITALTNYAAINSVSDVLPIVDITNNETKKIAMSVLMGLVTDITTTWKWSISGTTLVLSNGTDRVAITSVGRLGIATTTPGYMLEVVGDARVSTTFYCSSFFGLTSASDILIQTGAGRKITLDASTTGKVIILPSDGNIGAGTTTPNANALLDITSTTKAFLPPRMTTAQKNAIAAPTSGMVVYDSTLNKLCVYGAAAWETITSV